MSIDAVCLSAATLMHWRGRSKTGEISKHQTQPRMSNHDLWVPLKSADYEMVGAAYNIFQIILFSHKKT